MNLEADIHQLVAAKMLLDKTEAQLRCLESRVTDPESLNALQQASTAVMSGHRTLDANIVALTVLNHG